jgi:hypothetical protein
MFQASKLKLHNRNVYHLDLNLIPRQLCPPQKIAGAWRAAVAQNDHERARQYENSWSKAMGFVETLTLRQSDVFPFAVSDAAVGGVPCTLSRASIRIDQVSHSLHALVEGHQLVTATRKLGVHA